MTTVRRRTKPVKTAVQAPAQQVSPRRRELDVLRSIAGALCIGAGVFHLLYAPAHFDETAEIGFFFVVVGVDQIAAGLLIFAFPLLSILLATLAGTTGVIVLYIASRTTGLPFGPTAGEVEAMTFWDGLTTALEGVVVVLLAYLLGAYRMIGTSDEGERT
jgi:hypothetical protein